MAERGIVKYLGVLYSFFGEFGDTDGWAPQRRAIVKKANAFIASVVMVAPSLNEYRKLCNGLFALRPADELLLGAPDGVLRLTA